jgi:hypothetical protein
MKSDSQMGCWKTGEGSREGRGDITLTNKGATFSSLRRFKNNNNNNMSSDVAALQEETTAVRNLLPHVLEDPSHEGLATLLEEIPQLIIALFTTGKTYRTTSRGHHDLDLL